eukprot:jgi/Botrbrau1/9409/Bobra.0252s0034.1
MSVVDQFRGITGATEEIANFYLQSSNGNLEVAVNNFFTAGGNSAAAQPAQQPVVDPVTVSAAKTEQPTYPAAGTSSGRRPMVGNIRGLADISKEEDDSDEEEQNEYYAGGQKSGQVVRAPKDKDAPKPNAVSGLFDRARAAGAMEGNAEDLLPRPSVGGPFAGTARRLDGSEVQAPGGNSSTPSEPVVHTITFYRNFVFTVDDGEPRSLDDPSNKAFLDSVSRGECPAELEPPSRDTPITVNLLRREEDYQPPARPRYVAFQGRGRTLTGTSAGDAAAAGPSAADVSAQIPWEGIDESAPSASIQLRLSDGSRMVARFNLTHTVGDIRRFIRASRPDVPTTYSLFTAFPPKQLNDDSVTIQAAELANAVVLQKP